MHYRQQVLIHPLSKLLLAEVERVTLDVPGVTVWLGGGGFSGPDAEKSTNAYRLVAADLLFCMAAAGQLVQVEDWTDPQRIWEGGALFRLP